MPGRDQLSPPVMPTSATGWPSGKLSATKMGCVSVLQKLTGPMSLLAPPPPTPADSAQAIFTWWRAWFLGVVFGFLLALCMYVVHYLYTHRPTAPYRQRPVRSAVFHTLRTLTFYGDTKCPICQEEFVPAVDKVILLSCDHLYHVHCAHDWLRRADRRCPVCRDVVSITVVAEGADQ